MSCLKITSNIYVVISIRTALICSSNRCHNILLTIPSNIYVVVSIRTALIR